MLYRYQLGTEHTGMTLLMILVCFGLSFVGSTGNSDTFSADGLRSLSPWSLSDILSRDVLFFKSTDSRVNCCGSCLAFSMSVSIDYFSNVISILN